LLFVLTLTLASCGRRNEKAGSADSKSAVISINEKLDVNGFEKKFLELENAQIVDVRTPHEFEEGHIKGAINMDIHANDFENRIAVLDKKKPVFVYCLAGGRSSEAAEMMGDKQFTEVYNLEGGMMKWRAANKPLEDGVVADRKEGMTADDFNKLLSTEKFVLVDYNAKWCKPCVKMLPMLEGLAETKKDKLILVKIDADKNQSFLKAKGIEGIPVLELYKDGKRIWKHEGEIDQAALLKETGI